MHSMILIQAIIYLIVIIIMYIKFQKKYERLTNIYIKLFIEYSKRYDEYINKKQEEGDSDD